MSDRRNEESQLLRALIIRASELGARLFRNQRGVYKLARPECQACQREGRTVSSGMANGAPDLVGWIPVVVTPEMVGTRLAVFCGVEAKTPTGRLSDDQRAFMKALDVAGAVCGVVTSDADLAMLLAPWAHRCDPAPSSET